MPLSAGARLGPYEILAPVCAGGMGEVFRARDTERSCPGWLTRHSEKAETNPFRDWARANSRTLGRVGEDRTGAPPLVEPEMQIYHVRLS